MGETKCTLCDDTESAPQHQPPNRYGRHDFSPALSSDSEEAAKPYPIKRHTPGWRVPELSLPTDENGCFTRGDGECVSDGPCLHTNEGERSE